jgi:hypothetical protein
MRAAKRSEEFRIAFPRKGRLFEASLPLPGKLKLDNPSYQPDNCLCARNVTDRRDLRLSVYFLHCG